MRDVKNSKLCIHCKIHTSMIHTFSMFKRDEKQEFALDSHSKYNFKNNLR